MKTLNKYILCILYDTVQYLIFHAFHWAISNFEGFSCSMIFEIFLKLEEIKEIKLVFVSFLNLIKTLILQIKEFQLAFFDNLTALKNFVIK